MKILNFGSLNLDYVYQVDHFVRPGETMSAFSQTINPGGKGLNQSIALARAGVKVCHAGCLGTGGENLAKLLKENDVDTKYLRGVSELQGNAVIQVDSKGENCIILFGGSNQCVTREQIEETFWDFGPGDYLILQNEVNALPEIVEEAFHRGMLIFLNPSPCNEKIKAIDLGHISYLLVNEVEMEQLTGQKDPEAAWEVLHAAYPQLSLLVTLGEEGSMLFHEVGKSDLCGEGGSDMSECIRQEAFPVKAVDTTAAGDTYTGYFIASLSQGLPLKECMRRASQASAICVTRPGAAPSIPYREEIIL